MKKKILVTGAGGASGVSIIQALAEDGFELFAADMSGHAAGLYLVPEHRRLLIEPASSPSFASSMLELCMERGIDLLIPTVDAELVSLARMRSVFETTGTKVLVSSPLALERCLDKFRLCRLVTAIAPVPRTWIFDEGLAVEELSFPVIVKPRIGSGGRGVIKVESSPDLARLPLSDALIVQEYLPGTEYSVDVLATQLGRGIAAVPRTRLKVDSGVAVASATVHDEELEDLALRIVSLIGLTGVNNLQFRRDLRGRPCLFEINPRFPGTIPLTVAAGINMPVYAARDILGMPLPITNGFQEIGMVRTWREHFVSLDEMRALNPTDRNISAVRRTRTQDDLEEAALTAQLAASAG